MTEPRKRNSIAGRHRFIRNLGASNLLENFLIAGVVTVLGVRLYLHLTGYPQLGGGGLHIAHMLWGGLGMLAAIFIMLEFVNQSAREWAAIIGGIGFGTFIDELGKFVTADNNYFYQPAAAAIYVLFVALFLAARWLNRPGLLSPEEALANAAEIVQEGMLAGGLEDPDRQAIRDLLKRSNVGEPLAQALRGVLDAVAPLPRRRPHPLTRMRRWLTGFYATLASRGWFEWTVVGIFVVTAVMGLTCIALSLARSWLVAAGIPGCALALWALLEFAKTTTVRWRTLRWILGAIIAGVMGWTVAFNLHESPGSFAGWVDFAAAAATVVLVFTGVVSMHRSRLAAYQWFRRATLVSILITQVFTFYEYQFVALASLVISLLLLVALRYMISQEQSRLLPR